MLKKKASKKKKVKSSKKKVVKKTVKKTTSTKKTLKKKASKKKTKGISKKISSKKQASSKKVLKKKTTVSYSGSTATKINKGILSLNKKVPNFSVSSTSKKPFSLSDFKGKNIVLFFYPKDSTPGCTIEGQDFTKLHKKFKSTDTEVFGISKDSLKSHFKFIEKQKYSIDLLSDETEEVCNLFKVIKEKNMYGRKYFGIERSTFIISKDGKLLKEFRGVKVPGHAAEVLEFIKETV